MSNEVRDELTISITRTRGNARCHCTAKLGAIALYSDVIDPRNAKARGRFLQEVVTRAKAQDYEVTLDRCEQIVLQQLDERNGLMSRREPSASLVLSDQEILDSVGVEVLGENADQSIELFITSTRKRWRLKTPAKWPAEEIIQALGPGVQRVISCDRELLPSMLTPRDLQRAIASAASRAPRIANDAMGQGVWWCEEEVLVVSGSDAFLYDGELIKPLDRPVFNGRILDFTSTSWAPNDLAKRISNVTTDSARGAVTRLERLLTQWHWEHAFDARVQASLVAATFVQACWTWRPLNSIVGASHTGKSTLLQEVIVPVFGWCVSSDRATEAGIRQAIGNTSTPVVVDEFDKYAHRQDILTFFRTSSRGGTVLRGSRSQQAVAQSVKHIPWFAAIEMGDLWAQDRNRFIRSSLDTLRNRGALQLPSADELRELGQQLMAAAIWAIPTARLLADRIKSTRFAGIHGRIVESFSVPAAMYSVMCYGREVTDDVAGAVLADMILDRKELTEQAEAEERRLLADLLGSLITVRCDRGSKKVPIAEILATSFTHPLQIPRRGYQHDALAEAEARGLAIVEHDGTLGLFIVPDVVQRYLLASTRWGDCRLDTLLLRLEGATRCQQRCAGQRHRGIWLPYEGCLDVSLCLDDE